jgi:hypothetical protein
MHERKADLYWIGDSPPLVERKTTIYQNGISPGLEVKGKETKLPKELNPS